MAEKTIKVDVKETKKGETVLVLTSDDREVLKKLLRALSPFDNWDPAIREITITLPLEETNAADISENNGVPSGFPDRP